MAFSVRKVPLNPNQPLTTRNGIQIQSAILPQSPSGQWHTDWPTDEIGDRSDYSDAANNDSGDWCTIVFALQMLLFTEAMVLWRSTNVNVTELHQMKLYGCGVYVTYNMFLVSFHTF